jgi:hypothetical protein
MLKEHTTLNATSISVVIDSCLLNDTALGASYAYRNGILTVVRLLKNVVVACIKVPPKLSY